MEEKLLKIINKFGINNQQRKLAEEVFELNEAIIKHEELYEIDCYSNDKYREHIAEEIADVTIMLLQFKEYYHIDGNDISKIINEKIDRTIDRIEEGYYENERDNNNI